MALSVSLTQCPLADVIEAFQSTIFELITQTCTLDTSCETTLRPMPHNLFCNKSTLDYVMVWCRQANKPLPKPMLTLFSVTTCIQ